jgi:hypothetical protein
MIESLISDLQGLGYQLSLDGVNLRFRYNRAGEPPEGAAILLEGLRQHKVEAVDYLCLLDTPMAKLKAPLLIESARVGDTFYLVANEGQAKAVEEAGGIAYLPSEVRSILATSAGMDGDRLRDYLSKCHEVKKTFRGARIQ